FEQHQKAEQFRVIEPAIPGHKPDSPKRAQLLLAALVGSIGLAIGAALLAEHLDTSFHSVDDLRAVSPVPVLVSIPRIVITTDRRRQSMDKTSSSLVKRLVSLLAPRSFEAQQYRTLGLLIDELKSTALSVVAVSSPAPADGKTTTAIN